MEYTFYKITCENNSTFEYLDFTTSFKHKKALHKRNTFANIQKEPYTTINSSGGWHTVKIIVQKILLLKSREFAKIELENMKKCSQALHKNCAKLHKKLCKNPCSEIIPLKHSATNPELVCPSCSKTFSRKYSMQRHIKNNICKKQLTNAAEFETRIARLENITKTTPIVQNTNNTQNNMMVQNVQNTYNIVELGKENLVEFFTPEQQKQILRKRYDCLDYLVESVHFNEKYPQFNNVVIKNINNIFAYKFSEKENKFIAVNKDSLLDDILTYRMEDISDFYENNKHDETIDKFTIKSVERIIADMETEDNRKNKITDLKLIMYNNRNVVDLKK